MSLFRHPHLTRGIVRTPYGAFTITRGILDVPEEIGQAFGWQPIEEDGEDGRDARKFLARDAEQAERVAAGGDAY